MSYPQETFLRTSLAPGSLIARRREVVSSNTLLYQLDVLKKTGRYDAFKLKWHPSYSDTPDVWPVPNHLFWDSDVAKWIEGACYFLRKKHNCHIHGAIHELVEMIRSAQHPDGYLNIHYTVVEPGKRFTNLRDFHELYNAGHLIEAALAHHHLYGNNDLLEPILKYVDLLCRTFGPGEDQIHGYPGHPEIELALLRLYNRTQNRKHLELAQYFITERGNPTGVNGRHYYVVEAERRGDDPRARPKYWPEMDCLWYYQAHKPLVEQQTIKGHSVRAVYLLTAAADLVRSGSSSVPNAQLKDAVYRLWDNMVDRKMYATGGIGAIKQWEGFGLDYFLPQGTDEGGCYAETCAAIGVMMLAERILQYDLDRRFSDIMELCLYNAVLTSMSHDGTKFTYVNQLASSDQDLSKREEWFTCSCCPPNVLRLLGQIGGYIYSQNTTTTTTRTTQVAVHLYVSSTHEIEILDDQRALLSQKTNWPWGGQVDFELRQPDNAQISLALRIPAWAGHSWKLNPPPPPTATLEKGYLVLPSSWVSSNPSFSLHIPIIPRLVSPHPYTNQDILVLARGPIVYCVEDVDNPWVRDHFKSVILDASCCSTMEERAISDPDTNDDYVALVVKNGAAAVFDPAAVKTSPTVTVQELDRIVYGIGDKGLDGVNGVDGGRNGEDHDGPRRGPQANGVAFSTVQLIDELTFVPYYFRANRGGRGQMRVGLRRWHR
ncbi:hypothetical protein HRR83_000001 [Exophiala dermatitidis]|uniref:DUF1680 domain protein n=1 Tax=Exophiala dermatitidis TaxID=5970 RepID=A0AAN6IYA9_EXODE|nr:hypothetical protein HRR73_009596 [Exophiala dermatitidis]KAJ4524413.1 hypothetical protein HRR75_000001 [Exophiala dermatitidis]KAJ4527249.1 hypothetical protein HRR74_000001 [Exophiala dermatitidis]KAJ4530802.1 hypothetical protein HRR76_008497 [Exophiala dermatitidis]KAJ4549722.1 hypothetical protein HRR78_004531 [Exophiala dermatitidis]